MNSEVKFTVYGDPKGKARPRFRRVGKFTMTYTPKETVEYENKVKKSFLSSIDKKKFTPFTGPVEADALCVFGVPNSYSKKKKQELLGTPHTKKPDTDNICKALLDPLNEIAYEDDSQVCKLSGLKIYGEIPRVELTLKPYRQIIQPIRFIDNYPNNIINPIRFI